MNHNFQSICEYADRLSPITCRLLARKQGQKPLTTDEIAERSGLDRKTVNRVSKLKSWAKYLRLVDSFRAACGVTPKTERKAVAYVKAQRGAANPFPHLGKLGYKEKRMLARALKA